MVHCGACWVKPFNILQAWSVDSAQAQCGGQVYLVGGAVRDQLLGRPVTERDWVVVGSTPEQMLDAGFRPADPEFPVFLHPVTREEYALARRETSIADGYRGFALNINPQISIKEDLSRRDLTVNAIAQDMAGSIIDPYCGQQDLVARRLRHVTTAFAEDPVRVLRTARFAAELGHLGFTIAPETQQLMHQMMASNYELAAERIRYDMWKALAGAQPWHFFALLAQVGVQPVADIPAATQVEALAALRQVCRHTSDPDLRFVAYALHCVELDRLDRVLTRRVTGLLKQARRAWSQLTTTLLDCEPTTVWTFLHSLRAWHTEGNYAAVMQVLRAYQQHERLLARIQVAQAAASKVRPDVLRSKGLQGAALGQSLRVCRQAAIAAAWQ
ncbi:MAG: hypothetical protein AAF669_03490 [Pseudomonadota bacterium]